MSFSVNFFATGVSDARNKLQSSYAPGAVKALVELALAGIKTSPSSGSGGGAGQAPKVLTAGDAGNAPAPRPAELRGILVETHGHIDENGGQSEIGLFRVRPFYG